LEKGNLDQPTVLVVSDDAEFSASLTARWHSERNPPAFTLMTGDLCQDLDPEAFDAAIVGSVGREVLSHVLKALESAEKPVLLVCDESKTFRAVREAHPRLMVLRQHEGWLEAQVLIVSEALRRSEAVARMQRAERVNTQLQHQATLGGYMLEMRHNLSNALTSVLGNSELLLLEPGSLSASARSQIETIRNMALRMHEILQRFSSLHTELRVVERQAEKEDQGRVRAAGAGS
jgi:signal transduction histidine kinase